MTDQELSPDQYSAIIGSIELGKTLTKDHPEIAELYRQGNSLSTIMEELDIQSNYGVSESVAWSGVHRAIAGHDGSYKPSPYEGLIPNQKEREILAKEHMQEWGRKAYEEGLGIHGRTAEQMSEDGRERYSLGLGRRTPEQMIEDSRKGYSLSLGRRTPEQMIEDVRKGTIARGLTPWDKQEIEFADFLSQQPEYQRGSQVNNQLIALALNIEYHNCKEVRTPGAVGKGLSNYRKSLEDRVD